MDLDIFSSFINLCDSFVIFVEVSRIFGRVEGVRYAFVVISLRSSFSTVAVRRVDVRSLSVLFVRFCLSLGIFVVFSLVRFLGL